MQRIPNEILLVGMPVVPRKDVMPMRKAVASVIVHLTKVGVGIERNLRKRSIKKNQVEEKAIVRARVVVEKIE